ncbi:MAG TPA: MMPL family transporter [Gemmatimonadaceae bacterium]|nr:MMPL family transporter [Gemmatimonadaceae bacterium]
MPRPTVTSIDRRSSLDAALHGVTTEPGTVEIERRGLSSGVSAFLVRHRRWIAAAWVAIAVALIPGAVHVEEHLDVAARADGSESDLVAKELTARFRSPFARSVILVATGIPSPREASGREALADIVASIDHAPGVRRTISYLDDADTLFLGGGGRSAFIVVGLDALTRRPDTLIAPLRAATTRLSDTLRARYPELSLRWTGEVALNADLRRVSAADAQRAERRALPLTLLLLVLAFGSVAAAFLPVASALLAIGITLGAAALIARVWPLSVLLQNVVTMLGLGLGTDYALLVVSRFREARAAGRDRAEAAEEAARHTGRTIALSALAVGIGFVALLAVPLNELRSIAVGGLLAVSVSASFATTALPGILAWNGPGIDLGKVRRYGNRSGERWRRWGRFVGAHPLAVLVAFGIPVGALALQSTRLRTELPRGDWLPRDMESARALHDLRDMKRGGVVQEIRVVLELPPGVPATSDAGWSATSRLTEALSRDSAVATARSLPSLTRSGSALLPRAALPALVPDDIRSVFTSRDGSAALVEIIPREEVQGADLTSYIRRVRALDAGAASGLPGARLRVGGLPAFNADYEDAIGGRFFGIVAAIVGGTLLALALGFRSLLVPIKAVALNLLSVAAAFGAVVLVFQEGHGASLLGLSGGVDGTFPAIPILVFCTVFGLSMDYEVFLVARVAEARRSGHDEHSAIAEGLARTGGIITSAAAIMVVVFGAFTLGSFLLIKMLGFALAVAVLLDASVMRVAIGPALLALAGRWNWWPGERRSRDG